MPKNAPKRSNFRLQNSFKNLNAYNFSSKQLIDMSQRLLLPTKYALQDKYENHGSSTPGKKRVVFEEVQKSVLSENRNLLTANLNLVDIVNSGGIL
jgi:hypothetical protein